MIALPSSTAAQTWPGRHSSLGRPGWHDPLDGLAGDLGDDVEVAVVMQDREVVPLSDGGDDQFGHPAHREPTRTQKRKDDVGDRGFAESGPSALVYEVVGYRHARAMIFGSARSGSPPAVNRSPKLTRSLNLTYSDSALQQEEFDHQK